MVYCGYCENKNYMAFTQPLRFVLPHNLPTNLSEDQLFYIPYLRFKGHIFSCCGNEVEYRIIDATQIGYGSSLLPHTLGLRPQAMKIQLLGRNHYGHFVQLTEKVKAIFQKAAQLTTAFSKGNAPLYHRSFIGETISFIYLPTYFDQGVLMDGVLNRSVAPMAQDFLLKVSTTVKEKWLPDLLSMSCPHCAETLQGASDSLILECHSCLSLWRESDGRFMRAGFNLVESRKADTYLPFWKISCTFDQIEIDSHFDYLQLCNYPVIGYQSQKKNEHYFWVPAFKVKPQTFLRLAKKFTLSQRKLPEGKTVVKRGLYPTTLPVDEAVQALQSILAESCAKKRVIFPLLKKTKIDVHSSTLTYLPFSRIGHDLIEEYTANALSTQILNHGRTM